MIEEKEYNICVSPDSYSGIQSNQTSISGSEEVFSIGNCPKEMIKYTKGTYSIEILGFKSLGVFNRFFVTL